MSNPSQRHEAQRPMVVFVDRGMMLSFDQLAGVLRRRGIETVHISGSANPLARLSSSLVYHRSLYFEAEQELVTCLAQLPASRVVDIQCPEFLLAACVGAARQLAFPAAVIAQLETRQQWRDKFVVARRLRSLGIPAPRVVDLADHSPEQAVAQLGLPLVLKRRVGSGGEGVRVVREAQRVGVVAELLADPGQVYAEQFLTGDTLCYAAAFRDGQVLHQVVYQTLQTSQAEGPSSSIEVLDDPAIRAVGDELASHLVGPGLVNLDLVRDDTGQAYVVDVNVRAWHSVVALASLGHNFVDAYLESLGLHRYAASRHGWPAGTGRVNVFPDQSDDALRRSRMAGMQRFRQDLHGQREVLPVRYLAAQSLLFARRVAGTRPSRGRPTR